MNKNKGQFTKLALNIKQLKEQQKDKKVTFGVTYTAPYATRIHEDLEMFHANGQAKFLEEPLRKFAKQLTIMIKTLIKEGKTLRQAILITGYWLLGESQKLVPVATGALRDSGTVKLINSN